MSMQHSTLKHDGSSHFPLHLLLTAVSSWWNWWVVPLLLLHTVKEAVMADEIFVESGIKFFCYAIKPSKG